MERIDRGCVIIVATKRDSYTHTECERMRTSSRTVGVHAIGTCANMRSLCRLDVAIDVDKKLTEDDFSRMITEVI